MKKLRYIFLALCGVMGFTACDDTLDHDVAQISAPKMVSFTPGEGTAVRSGNVTVKIAYDMNIFFATEDVSKIQIDNGGTVMSAEVIGASDTLTVMTYCPNRATTYTLTVPEGVVMGPNGISVPSVSVQFTTRGLDTTPVMHLSDKALQVYDYLRENFEVATLSATMAKDGLDETESESNKGSWNTLEATQVYNWTGKYPAMNCFDYLHLASSSAESGAWINYGDITPVQNWWNAGGLVLAMWHWNVPIEQGSEDYHFNTSETEFNLTNAVKDGTWENTVVKADLEKVAGYLKQLQDAGIPVIWRPLHEASGGWFWWGTDAASYKALWKMMFDTFTAEGLTDLIWVWTSQTDDMDWYPGDEYVDIIGRDLYGTATDECAEDYQWLSANFGNKMVTLSECGYLYSNEEPSTLTSKVGTISEQWGAGARWLWFMPWYSRTDEAHADQEWWQDAMNQDYVITRDELPGFTGGN